LSTNTNDGEIRFSIGIFGTSRDFEIVYNYSPPNSIALALWLFGITLLYFLLRYSQGGTAVADHNPIVLFLASISAEPYNILSSSVSVYLLDLGAQLFRETF
jgi:hypothetical protein